MISYSKFVTFLYFRALHTGSYYVYDLVTGMARVL